MAFEITRTTVERLSAKVSCGCLVMREFSDWNYKTPLGEVKYTACEKHEHSDGTVEFILTEYLDTEITRVQNSAPTANNPQGGEVVRDAEGNEIGRKVPNSGPPRHRPQPKVRPALPPRQAPQPATPGNPGDVEIDASSIDAMINGTDEADNSETILPTTD